MDGHYRLKNNTHSSCIVDSVKGDILKVYYPPCECGDEFGAGCGEIHKSKLGEKIEGDINLHQIAWLCERVKDVENLYNLRVDKVMELEEGIDLIYKTLRSAEGIKEIMTGSEPECIAESLKFYVEGFHEKEDEIEGLKNNITSLVQEVGKSYQAARGCLQNLAFVGE